VTTTVPGQNALLNFEGTAGQRVSLLMTNSSFGGNCVYARILDPTNTSVAFQCMTTSPNFLEPVTLPLTGTYTLVVDPTSVATGSATFTLYDVPPDITGPITPGGSAVTVTFTTPGQNAQLTFANTAGQRVAILINNSTLGGNCSYSNIVLQRPDGSSTSTSSCVGSFLDPTTIAMAGTSTIRVNPYGSYTGSVTLTLYDVPPDLTDPVTPGTSTTTTITTPGQNALLPFSATANQRASLRVNTSTITSGYVWLLQPNGTAVGPSTAISPSFKDAVTLPVTGTYSVFVNPYGAATGQVTLTLYVFDDVTGSVTIGGPQVHVTITTPGQRALLTFTGAANQQITLHARNNTIYNVGLILLKPDGNQLGGVGSNAVNFDGTPTTLPVAGTYTLIVDPNDPVPVNTGSIDVFLTSP